MGYIIALIFYQWYSQEQGSILKYLSLNMLCSIEWNKKTFFVWPLKRNKDINDKSKKDSQTDNRRRPSLYGRRLYQRQNGKIANVPGKLCRNDDIKGIGR